MREHQIVITLKPEQFLEVQRMARVAGAKSMGMFVRHRLLVALGIESAPQTPARLTAGPDVKRITGELRRLHGELKAFVAESLAAAYIGPQEEAPGPSGAGEIDGLSFGFLPGGSQPAAASANDMEQTMAEFEHANEELEQMAQRAFAISPRLGPMEDFEEPAKLAEKPRGEERGARPERDLLDELLDDPLLNRIEDYMKKSRAEAAAEQAETQEHGEELEPEEEVFDVPLPMSEKSVRKPERSKKPEEPPPAPPPPPPPPPPGPLGGPPPGGISGGPPPRRRQ